MKLCKVLSMCLGIAMICSLAVSGCKTGNNVSDNKSAASQATVAQGDSKAKDAEKEPDEISIFYGTAGLQFPDGVKPDDNPYLNRIAELANVKFKEATVPEYADFQTKFNLMVSSGSIPDFVHCWFPADVQMYGDSGAFLEFSDIVAKSPVLSRKYSKSMINLMKDDNGRIYALRTLPPVEASAAGVRMDLIDELNNGKVPVTPEEWYEVFKKEKEKYPDSVPYSSAGGLYPLELFFKAYGVSIGGNGADWQYTGSEIISAFETPMCKDSVLYHKKLYDEGLLDKTFVTNKPQDFLDRKWNKKNIIAPNNLNSVINYIGAYITNNVDGAVFAAGPLPRVEDTRVTDDDVYTASGLLGWHCVAIGASTKQKDAVVSLIEALLSDEVMELTSWGLKDVDFTLENGQKKPTVKAAETVNLRKMYSFMFTYGSASNVEVSLADQLAKVDPSIRDEYAARVREGMKITYDQAAKANQNPASYIQLSADTQSKVKEAQELSKSIIIKAIIGEITMQEYDAQVSDYLNKYQFITDEYNAKLPATLEKLNQ